MKLLKFCICRLHAVFKCCPTLSATTNDYKRYCGVIVTETQRYTGTIIEISACLVNCHRQHVVTVVAPAQLDASQARCWL